MIELAPRIFFIPGKNQARFPYCNGLYIEGKEARVLIDAGMGAESLSPCIERGVDVLLLSHCHVDHRLTRRLIPEVPVWCHEKEVLYLRDMEFFIEEIGFRRGELNFSGLFNFDLFSLEVDAARILVDEEILDFGDIKVQVIHTPGHTPGHLSFYLPEADLLFCADIDLTSFGPFYGHDFANIADFIDSIHKLNHLGAKHAATGHSGPYDDNVDDIFKHYEGVIYERDRIVLEQLNRPCRLDDLLNKNLIYSRYPKPPDFNRWFEQVHLEKHLERLSALGRVQKLNGIWKRCGVNN